VPRFRKAEGKLALHAIDSDPVNGKDIEKWKAVAERLTLGETPPESEKRPDAQHMGKVVAWIKAELARAGVATSDAERKLLLGDLRIVGNRLFAGGHPGGTAFHRRNRGREAACRGEACGSAYPARHQGDDHRSKPGRRSTGHCHGGRGVALLCRKATGVAQPQAPTGAPG
jgi:hypothetical protein